MLLAQDSFSRPESIGNVVCAYIDFCRQCARQMLNIFTVEGGNSARFKTVASLACHPRFQIQPIFTEF